MKTSLAGIALIQSFESCVLAAYPDPAVGWALPTAGWGHTGPDVHRGMVIDRHTADLWFAQDLAKSESVIETWVTVPLSQNQFDPLVSIVFNVGPGNPNHRDGIIWLASGAHSTMLRKLLARDYIGASCEFPRWDLPKNLPGILRRRLAEQEMFLSGIKE
jgi:lysozyme